MAKYRYQKKKPWRFRIEVDLGSGVSVLPTARKTARVVSMLFIVSGLCLIGAVIAPLVQWQLAYLPRQAQSTLVSPTPRFASPFFQVSSGNISPGGQVLATDSSSLSGNYDNAAVWFPTIRAKKNPKVQYYTLTIPKLRIENATVEFGGTDLKTTLIGWPDSSLPGVTGNNIIFGHSALPQFYNPTNYHTIFSLLPTLKTGDEVLVNYDGVSYRYEVFAMETVEPTDYSVLEQRFDDSYLTLITCVPPGTYWKRLVIRCRLVL